MCGLRTRPRTDVDPPRVELPSAGAYRLAARGAMTCRLTVFDCVHLRRMIKTVARVNILEEQFNVDDLRNR